MNIEANTTGFEESYKNLQRLAVDNPKALKKGIEKAQSFLEDKLIANTPVWTGEDGNEEHAKDHVVSAKVRMIDGELTGQVGFDEKVYWRIKFIEIGTVHQKPQGFIQKTGEDPINRLKVKQIIAEIIRRELGL